MSTTEHVIAPAQVEVRRHGFRRDVQGLRAFAVLAVVLDHLLHWPGGGFIGVDVFFVLSGFLITGLLLRELEKTGRISFGTFYARRVKRLLPAAMAAILATVGAAYLLVGSSRFSSIVTDAIWATFFGANWRFASVGTDYFEAGSAVSPLQHFWSLSVEEQFYFVWPVVMLIIAMVILRKRRSGGNSLRAALGVAIAVLSIASLAWGAYETVANPTFAYFSTFSRAWELGAGAIAALAASKLERIPPVLGAMMGWLGVVGIVAAVVIVPPSPGFPVPWAFLPVISAVLVIIGGLNRRTLTPFVLDNPFSRYVGDISYSLYLWHFPVIILLGPYLAYVWKLPDPAHYTLLVALMFVLAIVSYHGIENPVRHSNWLTGTARSQGKSGLRARQMLVAGVGVVVTISLVFAFSVDFGSRGLSTTDESVASSAPPTEGASDPGASGGAAAELGQQISEALTATSWPENLVPSPENPADDDAIIGIIGKCGGATLMPAAECTLGDPNAPKLAIVVGDSIAQAYMPGIATFLATGEWRVRMMSMYACPFVDLPIGHIEQSTRVCADRRAAEVAAILESTPNLVIVSTTFVRGFNQNTGATATAADFLAGYEAQLEQIKGAAPHIVQLMPPPADKDIKECYTPYSKPADCVSRLTANDYANMSKKFEAITEAAGGVFIPTSKWYCNDRGQCPAFVGSTTRMKDQAHITSAYAVKLGPVIAEALTEAGVLE